MKKILFILIAVVISACSAIQPKSELERAHEKWQDAGISHYRFNLAVSCFCAFNEDMPLVIEVQDGEVISMKYHTGKEVDAGNLELFQRYATIDKIFAELEKAAAGEADNVTVTYDETHGFPTQVSIDFEQQAADDEIYLTITNFEALP